MVFTLSLFNRYNDVLIRSMYRPLMYRLHERPVVSCKTMGSVGVVRSLQAFWIRIPMQTITYRIFREFGNASQYIFEPANKPTSGVYWFVQNQIAT